MEKFRLKLNTISAIAASLHHHPPPSREEFPRAPLCLLSFVLDAWLPGWFYGCVFGWLVVFACLCLIVRLR